MKKKFLAITTLISVTFLVGCGGGGGGGGGDSGSGTTSYPIQQAIQYAGSRGVQQTLSVTGTANNGATTYPVNGTLTFTIGGATSGTFNGNAALQSPVAITGNLTVNGQTVPLNLFSTSYVNSSYASLGTSATGSYCVAAAPGVYPTTATAGQTGTIASYTCYSDSTKATRIGTQTLGYVTSAGTGDALNFQAAANAYDSANTLIGTTSTVYSITAAGIPTLIRVGLTTLASGVLISLVGQ